MKLKAFVSRPFAVNSYLLEENARAILIDPVLTEELLASLGGLTVERILLTHEHYDHILGAPELRKRTGADVYCGRFAAEGLQNPALNLSRYAAFLSSVIPFAEESVENAEFSMTADGELIGEETLSWQGHTLMVIETPGHSAGSVCYLLDETALFSGDTIFKDYETALKLPGGSKEAFEIVTTRILDTMPQDLKVCPGHGESFLLSERNDKRPKL